MIGINRFPFALATDPSLGDLGGSYLIYLLA